MLMVLSIFRPQHLMRAVALSVWLFLNLGFFGMCGYIYLLWAQNWRANYSRLNQLSQKPLYNPKDPIVFFETVNHTRGLAKRNETPRTQTRKTRKRKCRGEMCDEKLQAVKNDILLQMRRVLHDESSVFKTDNPYHVDYRGPRDLSAGLSSENVLCRLRSAGLRTLNRFDSPFNHIPLGDLLDDGKVFRRRAYDSCAIVSNAGSLLESRLGPLIDNHELVVRFNHAPTRGFESDVGSKTNVRIVNSQVVTKEEFSFTTSKLFQNVTTVVWDPSNYSSSLEQWFEKPDFDFFLDWARHKQANLNWPSGILDPRSVWKVWDALQSLTALRIRRNPPSSGFLGLVLMLEVCEFVDMFEYVPSNRISSRCHYFDELEDVSCTLGVWHPLAAEKFLTLAMNLLNDSTVFETGFVRISGFNSFTC